MDEMSYASQLRHPSWQKRRLEMLDRAGFECNNCGDAESPLEDIDRVAGFATSLMNEMAEPRMVWLHSPEVFGRN